MSTARGKIQRRSVTGDSAPFDIPPPKFGQYRVQHQIGVGAMGPNEQRTFTLSVEAVTAKPKIARERLPAAAMSHYKS